MKKQTWRQWVHAIGRDVQRGDALYSGTRLFHGCLAALTGQDTQALNAIVACYELYACSDADGRRGALAAIRALLPAMQESTRWLARELIPFALDWSDRDRLWSLISPPQEASAHQWAPVPFPRTFPFDGG